jgi:hypothetical protein
VRSSARAASCSGVSNGFDCRISACNLPIKIRLFVITTSVKGSKEGAAPIYLVLLATGLRFSR